MTMLIQFASLMPGEALMEKTSPFSRLLTFDTQTILERFGYFILRIFHYKSM